MTSRATRPTKTRPIPPAPATAQSLSYSPWRKSATCAALSTKPRRSKRPRPPAKRCGPYSRNGWMDSVLENVVRQFVAGDHIKNVLAGEWVDLYDGRGAKLVGIRGRIGAASLTQSGHEIG